MNRKRVVSTVILFALAMLNTGCIQKYFNDTENRENKVENKKRIEVPTRINSEISSTECVDEIKPQESSCDRGTISKEELNSTPKKGEVYTLKSIRGKVIHIAKQPKGYAFPEYRGKVVILEMFGKDCPHCINEIPIIKKIRNRYRGKLEVIAIQSQDRMSKFTARDYINRHKIRYPIIEGEDATNLQYSIQETFGWTGILPYTLVIKNGVVEYIYSGEVSYKDLQKDINEII
jgi:thiol-disulfide isomerase/thioredoxin